MPRPLSTALAVGALVLALVLAAGRLLTLPAGGGPATAHEPSPVDPEAAVDQTPAPPGQLHPGLATAIEAARAAAAAVGHDLVVTSGYRSPERQQQLLDEEVAERGSYEEATRWVFPPDRSMHVRGLAVDVGDGPAADWLQANGARWGLCRTLGWEWWHFEWRERWEASATCPVPAVDPAGAPTE